MKRKRQNLALGLATLLFLALFLASFVFVYPALREVHGRTVSVIFPHEEGMAPIGPGTPVLLAGALDVGRVRSVWFDQRPPRPEAAADLVFVVDLEIREDVPLYGDAEVTTGQPPVGGAAYVVISDIGTPGVPLEGALVGQPPASLSGAIGALSRRVLGPGGLLDQISGLLDPESERSLAYKMLASMDDVNAMTRELRVQMSPAEERALLSKIHVVLDDVNAMTQALRGELTRGAERGTLLAKVHAVLDHLNEGLSSAAEVVESSAPLIRDTLTNVEQATEKLDRDVIAALGTQLDPANPQSLLGRLHTAAERADAALAAFQALMSDAHATVALNRPVIEQTIANLRGMSQKLDQASQEVLLNPSILLRGPGRREEQLAVFQAASSFADAATQLDRAATQLRAILGTLPVEGPLSTEQQRQLQAVYDDVRGTFQRFGRAEEALWRELE
ncbi:MAG: hypothetical protein AB1716_17490 [Planctomycetota bacterium]